MKRGFFLSIAALFFVASFAAYKPVLAIELDRIPTASDIRSIYAQMMEKIETFFGFGPIKPLLSVQPLESEPEIFKYSKLRAADAIGEGIFVKKRQSTPTRNALYNEPPTSFTAPFVPTRDYSSFFQNSVPDTHAPATIGNRAISGVWKCPGSMKFLSASGTPASNQEIPYSIPANNYFVSAPSTRSDADALALQSMLSQLDSQWQSSCWYYLPTCTLEIPPSANDAAALTPFGTCPAGTVEGKPVLKETSKLSCTASGSSQDSKADAKYVCTRNALRKIDRGDCPSSYTSDDYVAQCIPVPGCSVPEGGPSLAVGESRTYYQSAQVTFPGECVSEVRTCQNSASEVFPAAVPDVRLSGTYTNTTCSVLPPTSEVPPTSNPGDLSQPPGTDAPSSRPDSEAAILPAYRAMLGEWWDALVLHFSER